MYDTAVFDFDGVLYNGFNIYPNVKCMLTQLKRKNVKMFIASYNPFASYILSKNGLDIFFEAFYCYFDNKNKVSHLNQIMSDHNIDKSQIVFFDDTPINVYSVSAIGITSSLVVNGKPHWCRFFK